MDERKLNKEQLNAKLNTWAGTKGIDYTDPEFGIAHCFKRLVPKLQQLNQPYGYTIQVEFPSGSDVCWASIVDYKELPEKVYSANNKQPALALCLATEKLIDEEGK